ncbi:MAG TPA: type II secretion system F family protein [Parvularculaceae bacterium]|nr:type II secretion system F family protein [Parvularculaceae bacterium]
MDQQLIMIAVLGLVVIGALAFVFLAPTQNDKTKKRLSSLETKKNARRASVAAATDKENKDRRKKVSDALTKIENKSKEAQKAKKRATLEQKLEQAGLAFGPRQFYIGSVVAALVMGFVGFISGQKLLVTVGLVFIGGLGMPNWFVGMQIKKRQKKFADEFSNAIDVIVRGVKSGLPVNECLKIIASEAPKPVNEEFEQLVEGFRIGLSLEQGMTRMYERMPLQEVSFFGIVLMIQQKTGGNLAEALTNLAGVLRGRKLMEGKIKALSSEAKASAMIIGALPFLVMGAVKLSSPDYLDPLFNTPTGNFILLGAGLWMGMGIFVMKSMMKIKV